MMKEKESLESILGDWKKLMESISSQLEGLGIINLKTCDHICYRVETLEKYSEVKSSLLKIGKLAGETIVSGRPISIVHLNEPLKFKDWVIDCVELPAPKEGSPYPEGFEHAEFVIENLDEFINNHQGLKFNTKAMGRDINPELGLKLDHGFQVKFHPLHILEVIKKEHEEGITQVN